MKTEHKLQAMAMVRSEQSAKLVAGTLSGLLLVAGLVLLGLDEGVPHWGLAAAALFAVLSWASMLRPALWADGSTLVLRNMFETVYLPMAAVEGIALRQVLSLRVGGRRYVSPVIGRKLGRAARRARVTESALSSMEGLVVSESADRSVSHADMIEQRLRVLCAQARRDADVRLGSPEQAHLAGGVRREPAWVSIGLTALLLAITLVS